MMAEMEFDPLGLVPTENSWRPETDLVCLPKFLIRSYIFFLTGYQSCFKNQIVIRKLELDTVSINF